MKKIAKIVVAFVLAAIGATSAMIPAWAEDSSKPVTGSGNNGGSSTETPIDSGSDPFCDNLSQDAKEAMGCGETGEKALPNAVENIIKFVIGVAGLVAVVYIIVGGIGYMTADGDASKIVKAKTTILYALIGLAVTALAFAIVNFAISGINGKSEQAGDEPPSSEQDVPGGEKEVNR